MASQRWPIGRGVAKSYWQAMQGAMQISAGGRNPVRLFPFQVGSFPFEGRSSRGQVD